MTVWFHHFVAFVCSHCSCHLILFCCVPLVELVKKMAGILFEDIFDVKDIDPDGKKFDRGLLSVYTIFPNECLLFTL